MSAIELLPCPFCKTGDLSFGNDMGRGVVQCHDCNAYIVADSEDEAITLWNTRADLPPTLSAAMGLPEVRALVVALRDMRRQFSPYPSQDTERWREEHEACEHADAALAAIKEPKT